MEATRILGNAEELVATLKRNTSQEQERMPTFTDFIKHRTRDLSQHNKAWKRNNWYKHWEGRNETVIICKL